MKANKLMIFMAGLFILSIWGLNAYALKAPHNNSKNVVCSTCHKSPRSAPGFLAVTSFDNMCLNAQSGCHVSNPGAKPDASKKRLTRTDASNRFKNIARDSYYATYSTNKKQSSHGWKIPNTNPDAGATNNWAPMREYGDSRYLNLKTRIYCTRCHRAHGDAGPGGEAIYKSFLKADPTGDYICFQCHASRRIGDATNTNVRGSLPASIAFTGSKGETITVAPHYSHPVEVNYSSARAKAGKSSLFFKNPTSAFPANASAKLKLYTTKGGVKGAVVCSTCHGPLHSADSNPYTFDSLSTYSRTNNYSTSAGNLLRRYPMSKSDDICVSCHKVTTHRTFKCNRCHTPHKKAGENNRYLILENISTPYSGKKAVQFISTSAMAFRYTNSVPGKSAICQVCHTGTEKTLNHHYNYSSNTVDRSHNYDQPSGKYRFCAQCHVHSAGFAASGPAACGSCHKSPPNDTYGKHSKHVGVNGTYDWGSAELGDSRSSSVYGFSCGRCHSKWAPYTSSGDYPRHQPASGFDDDNFGRYTAEVGFLTLSTMTKDPASARNVLLNPGATYTYGARGTRMEFGNVSTAGTSGSWFSWPTTGTCNNLYCHGQFFNGYTSNNPTWQGTQTCGKCHGVAQELGMGIPGKTGSVSYGAHQRHVGAGTQEYGQLSPRFRCNACHNDTSGMNNATTLNKNQHVNGRTNVKFDAAYGDSASTYGGLNNYSGKTNRNAASPKTIYKTCAWIYCHSDGSRLMGNYSGGGQVLAFKYPNWSSTRNFTTTQSSTKRRCSRCHGADRIPGTTAFSGITAAMPGYASRTGKGNSHYKHVVENGFKCSVCHSKTVNTDNKSIYFVYSAHINKRYDVDIVSSYGGTYDSATKKCSNVECHGNRPTPAWGNPANCQDCHMSTTADTDKRILPRSKFTGWTSSAPKIYSTQWTERGHGRSSGNYDKSGNVFANQACSACHRESVKHGTGTNPFRLITAPDRPNIVCNRCHGVGGSGALKTGILTHASSVTKDGHNYEIKCVDCHDPHGDNNIFMLHSTLPRPGVMARDVASGKYGIITSTSQSVNVDFVNNQYTSDYAKKRTAPKVCQQCHDETKKPSSTDARFRFNTSVEKGHGTAKCTSCHMHTAGFKGAGCNGCHGNPPTGTFNLLSGAGRVNATKKSPSGSSASESKQFGAHSTHVSIYGRDGSTSCIKCHYSGMWDGGAENTTIDLEFRFDIYTGATQKYRGLNAVNTGNYGYAGNGAGVANDTQRCESMKCHGGGGWLTASYGNVTAPKWDAPATARCGKCHGAKKAAGSGSWPTSKAHTRHAGTNASPVEYDFMCKLCHNATVQGTATTLDDSVHVNAQANFAFDSLGDPRVNAGAYNGDNTVNSGFGTCEGTYCHSRGTDTAAPYDGAALPNYTANWNDTASGKTVGKPCSYCHGNKTYGGITAAMPTQGGQAHAKHARNTNGDNFRCNVCHANVVDASGNIISRANHVNKFKNISVIKTYKTANEGYSDATKKCSSIKCHGERTTPAWNSTATCTDCHYSTASPEDSFSWQNYSGTVARIYSTEWMKRGHGKTKVSGKYPFSNNTGAGKTCNICHTASVKHNQANYFRLRTTVTSGDSDKLCAACHGSGAELGKMGAGTFGKITGILSHTYFNMSTYGDYNGGTPSGKAGWDFTPKCVDCHDPHGDNNNAMLHRYVNMTGSDTMGRPTLNATAQVTYTAVGGGTQIGWSSFVRSGTPVYTGICQRCHSAEVDNFDKAQFSNHQNGQSCKNCHKHKKGFAPTGCDTCHGYPAPPSPTSKGWAVDSLSNKSSVHVPHAWNVRARPGIPTAENTQNGGSIPSGQRGYFCNRCHDGTDGTSSDGTSGNHMNGAPGKPNASMKNMTMVYGDWSPGANAGYQSVADDTCRNVACHTPRYYTRGWKKPGDCDDCHGYVRTTGANRAFQLQTTGSHKTHINWTATPTTSWKKNYRFACSRCHYDPANNYSTHYSGMVNFTAQGSPNNGGAYSRGKSFKGFTTGSEHNNTSCTKTYCHGNFQNGTTATTPSWKKGQSAVKCGSCHKAKTAQFAAWQNGTTMPSRHPKHVRTATYNFGCSKCHVRTATNNTTVQFNWSSHANTRVDVYFDNVSGVFNSGNKTCQTSYCHSRGNTQAAPYVTANYTAKWTDSNKGCNYCHGDRTQTTWAGITSAMPNNNAHVKHARNTNGDNFRCSFCHANVVNNSGQIISYTNHVNKFKNISVIKTYKTANEAYNPSGAKTCASIKCHNGRTTPAWTSTANCQACHYKSSGAANEEDSFTWQNYSGSLLTSVADIYSSEWAKRGHGKSGIQRDCSKCHNSSKKHNLASNPFRLYTSDSDKMCAACHGSGTELGKWGVGTLGNKTGIKSHTQAETGGDAGWNLQNSGAKCVDCHDPHGDRNKSMIHSFINHTGSTTYGEPGVPPSWAKNGSAVASMVYTSVGAQTTWSSFVKPTNDGLCQRCHSAEVANFDEGEYTLHNAGARCPNCHSHKSGFKGGGESTGNQSCDGCHSSLSDPMKSQVSSYHHVMQNTSATGGSKYPTANNISSIDPRRRCLMCHADHDIFNPAVNTNTPLGRAGNLRESITVTPNATADTGFAKSDFIKNSTKEGICISCHKIAQNKNKTKQFNDNSSKTLRITYEQYSSSPHSYVVPSSQYLDTNGSGDTSRFDANCVKCHNDTMTKTKFKASTSFGLHDSQLRRINSKLGLKMDSGTATAGAATTLTDSTKAWVVNDWVGQPVTITSGTGVGQTRVVASNTATVLTMTKTWTTNPNATSTYTIGDPVEENYCYNCHGVSQNPNFASGKDYYGVATYVNTKALKMEQTFNGVAGALTAAAIGPPTTITDTAKAWSTNQWAGYIIKITSGKRAGSEGEILSNTATQVTLVTPWSKVPAAADQYSIGNPFRHRIDNFGGQHKSDEGLSAPGGLTTFGWFTAVGTKLHVGCADCHNPHAQRKPASDRGTSSATLSTISTVHDTTKSWTANQWVGFKLVPASRSQIGSERVIISNTATKLKVDAVFSAKLTGVYYYINPLGRAKVATAAPATEKGNMLNGPNNGQWGATPTAWNATAPSASAGVDNTAGGPSSFAKITTLTSGTNYIYQLCFKCHSDYGWGTSGTPFNTMGGNVGSEGASTDIAAEFNPNNLAHHAVVDIGKNQPIVATGTLVGTASYYNANWPKYSTGTVSITTGGVATFSGNVFTTVKSAIPGWYLYASTTAIAQGRTTGWYQITQITGANTAQVTPNPGSAVSGVAFSLTAGLGNNFVPPYGPWSVISCADCHDTDGASDPKGPHGSGQMWLLKGLRKQTFAWWDGTAMQTTSYGAASANFDTDNSKMICLNCHRADVYGFNSQTPINGTAPANGDDILNVVWKGNWSRETHVPDGSDSQAGDETVNPFKIYCMNCHLGSAMGQVHGTNMGSSLNKTGGINTVTGGLSYRGKRFLTGGAWVGVKRGSTSAAGTCYVESGTVIPDTINSCNDNSSGLFSSGVSNYNYQEAADY